MDEDEDDDEDEDKDEEEEEEEDEDEDEDANQNGNAQAEDDSESDIMIDDLDDDALMELDGVIAKLMRKERKPKMKQPHSSKGMAIH